MAEESIVICDIAKSDSISLDSTICDDITGWKITSQLVDNCGNCIKLATANVTGGSDDQIKIESTSATESIFNIMIAKNKTTCFADVAFLKVQVETTNIVGGETEKLSLETTRINFKQKGEDDHND